MKLITQLSGSAAEGEHREPRGIVANVHSEPSPGVQLKIMLGGGGLVIRRGPHAVAVPLASLIDLAAAHCPELIALADAPAAPQTPLAKEVARLAPLTSPE